MTCPYPSPPRPQGSIEVFDDAIEGADEAQESNGRPEAEQPTSRIAEPGETIGDMPFVFRMRHFNNARSTGKADTSLFVLTNGRYSALVKMFPAQEDLVMDNAMSEHEGEQLHVGHNRSCRGWRSSVAALR